MAAPAAHLLTGPPLVQFDPATGLRLLERDVAVDMGQRLQQLEAWGASGSHPLLAIEAGPGTTILHVPAGLRYDGASIPGWAQAIAGEKERYEVAAVLHDACYQSQAPRASADLVFWTVARSGATNVGPVRGWLTWAALRCFGWYAYSRE